ncbi:hypothetical protein COMA2_230036 [Candidatus Nitrospira nitrificans]|uniref:Uncharacterized protein n=1 Tax=Candidatus Nitrospira nitrificans TaxID=1742973 RepID=A0A0S4LKJ2_9BACT|nr:hypothetical protein COMA2_230036 [Candidatus Nitrospira nitrificans]
MAVHDPSRSPSGGMADRRGLAGFAVRRDGSRGLFQVGGMASGIPPTALPTIPHDDDLRAVRVRSCREHGHFCRGYHRTDASSGKGCVALGNPCALDRILDDVADRLYCGSLVVIGRRNNANAFHVCSRLENVARTSEMGDKITRTRGFCKLDPIQLSIIPVAVQNSGHFHHLSLFIGRIDDAIFPPVSPKGL